MMILKKYFTAAVIYVDQNHGACGGSTELVIDWAGDPDKKVLYSTVLAAFSAGHKVAFGAYDCNITTPLLYRVDVGK